jgi:thiol-disulfide isomerase/thioredoxin
MANGKFHLPTGRLIALAIIAGMSAGALGVYLFSAPSGNIAQRADDVAQAVPASNSPAVCEANEQKLAAVDEAARGEVAAMLPASPSQSLADLAFNAPDGTPMTVADLSGKTLLINLWATWCAPCRHEMPALDQLEAEMGSDKFEVVAINVDTGSDEKPKAFLEEIQIGSLDYYRDSTLGLFNDLKRRGLAFGLPVTLLVDDRGCLLAHMNGPAEWASPDAKRLIEASM